MRVEGADRTWSRAVPLSLHQLGHRAHQFPQYVTFLALSCCFFLPLGTARQQEQQKKERSRPLQSHAAALTISHYTHLQGSSALVLRLRSAAALPPPLCKAYQHKQVSLNLCSIGGLVGWLKRSSKENSDFQQRQLQYYKEQFALHCCCS